MIKIEKLKLEVSNLGHITNTYIIYDEDKNAVIIDPADESFKIIDVIKKYDLNVKYVFITHVHADHVSALNDVVSYTGAKVLCHEKDYDKFSDVKASCADILDAILQDVSNMDVYQIKEQEYSIKVGNMDFFIINTPGHTSGSIVIYEKNTDVLFSGDTIFSNSYGRCDLISGSFDDIKKSVKKIEETFDSNTKIFPGHGEDSNIENAMKRIKLLIAIKRG